ncbi:hypothetical protein BDV26DRAFT_281748 [Aspergillus bertholletiae]|uniref:Uncharacterized protein n=1 Tax=Aspergillus bertholletiae TaxID=1226010 RepID=A0A5N7B6D3_9EURO|nr:hypothetical protein BDV26DRAFT_281748 [Aspergillus bertholletiae]
MPVWLWIVPLLRFVLNRTFWPGGKFLDPNGAPQCVSQESIMNVSWQTKYSTINLYLILVANYDDPVALWRVGYPIRDDFKPFVLQLVNAQGSSQEQTDGGIWSARFWIGWNQDAVSTSTLTHMPTPTASATMIDGSHNTTTTSVSQTSSPESNSESSSSGRTNKALSVVHGGPYQPTTLDRNYADLAVPQEGAVKGKQVYELCGESSRHEVDGDHVRYELS